MGPEGRAVWPHDGVPHVATEPLSAQEIARAVIAPKGLEDAGPFVLLRVTGMIDVMLQRREGLAARIV